MHLSGELLKMMTGAAHRRCAYKGSGPVATDVLGGQVPLGIVDVPSAIANVKAGKLRALAVTTKQRISAAARRADVRGSRRAGLRVDRLVRRRRAGRHAERRSSNDSMPRSSAR